MTRVKRGVTAKKKHRKIKQAVKGYIKSRRGSIKKAKEALLKAGQHSYFDRKKKKSIFRKMWIAQINAALKSRNIAYRDFIWSLKQNKIEINRKVLSQIAREYPQVFDKIIDKTTKS